MIACGTNHEGLGAVQDGELIEIEIERIGAIENRVVDEPSPALEEGGVA